jgi:hypothetical protein
MNNADRKKYILSQLAANHCPDVFAALNIVGGDVGALEGLPVELGNRVTIICEDYMDGILEDKESIEKLKEFVRSVPDQP